jgi:hypothetical protein
MSPAGSEPTALSGERPHTHTLDRANIYIAFDEHKHVMFTDKLLMATTVIGVQIHHTCNNIMQCVRVYPSALECSCYEL